MSEQAQQSRPASSEDLPSLDFISSADLRQSLESDYLELTQALSAHMWKSACVLAGSIAEATLLDYIKTLGGCPECEQELTARNVGLSWLIDVAIGIDVLADSQPPATGWSLDKLKESGSDARKSRSSGAVRISYQMSSTIENFRNLIHPGRSLRLKERVDRSTAEAARAFVDRLLQDLKEESATRYPYRAEDIIEKAEKDVGARTVLTDMLHKTRPTEISRLLTDVGPGVFLGNCHRPEELSEEMFPDPEFIDDETVQKYQSLCRVAKINQAADAQARRLAFDVAAPAQKCAGVHAIAELLKTEETPAVLALETELLQVSDLEYAADDDRGLIVGDVLDRICSPNANRDLMDSAAGIGRWIPPERGAAFTNALLDKKFLPRVEDNIRRSAFSLLEDEYENMQEATREVVRETVKARHDRTPLFDGIQDKDNKIIDDLTSYWDSLSLVKHDTIPQSQPR